MPYVASIGTDLPCWGTPLACSEAVNQVDGAWIRLAHNIGGPTAVSAVTILEGAAHGAR